ncbi:hypothetical protein PPERSA_07386 [Pseudocohnilembus persalinus]|uniref:Uncharacterized protein n=1 Tax=Pseudocohnilembus persalinus TaxID=266149 RepID=A0A0V0QAP3_PSEPJ|nr:hypothetical protein PPERSA_07386 [Pseudocohnilembus persalinus]|eukprot:KRW99143.1 hypothetical protein PPERSA_07386 [Pseudocohnilembus persalinus]
MQSSKDNNMNLLQKTGNQYMSYSNIYQNNLDDKISVGIKNQQKRKNQSVQIQNIQHFIGLEDDYNIEQYYSQKLQSSDQTENEKENQNKPKIEINKLYTNESEFSEEQNNLDQNQNFEKNYSSSIKKQKKSLYSSLFDLGNQINGNNLEKV